MDLIQDISKLLNLNKQYIHPLKQYFHHPSSYLLESDSETHAYFFQNFTLMDLISHIHADFQHQNIKFKFSPTNTYFLHFHQKFQIGFAIRMFLKYNSSSIHINSKLNPKNGQIILTIQLDFISRNQTQNFLDFLEEISSVYLSKCKQEIAHMFELLPLMKQENKEDGNFQYFKELNRIKRFLITSPLYSWKILQEHTLSGKQTKKMAYEITKNNYEKMEKYNKSSDKLDSLSSIQTEPLEQLLPYVQISRAQDEQLKSKYLQRSVAINKNSYQINEITISNQAFNFLKRNCDAKITCSQLGVIKIKLQILEQSRLNELKYHKIVISSLPKNQFIGIPKYYYLKNFQKESQLFLITNLTFVKLWDQFIASNRESISFFTLLSLTYQMAIILRYLKQNNIVLHQLTPSNLVIKRGLCVNIINLSNSYNPYIPYTNQDHYPAQNKLPYVLNYFNQTYRTYGDERSDSYNLGIFLYQSIFQKTPHNIKDRSKLKQYQYILKLQKNPLICLQKSDQIGLDIFKIMTYLALLASYNEIRSSYLGQKQMIHKLIKKTKNNPSKQQNINPLIHKDPLSERPYLDWIAIIIKNIIDYTHLFY